jgi:hypothetical protein
MGHTVPPAGGLGSYPPHEAVLDPWLLHRMEFGYWSARRQSPSRRR